MICVIYLLSSVLYPIFPHTLTHPPTLHICRDYEAAAFCCEEILMVDQMHAGNHTRLADVYYTLGSTGSADNSTDSSASASKALAAFGNGGGALQTGSGELTSMDYLLLARKHYTIGLDRQGPAVNLQGVYGLLAAAKAIDSRLGAAAGADKPATAAAHATTVSRELLKFAQEHVVKLGLPLL